MHLSPLFGDTWKEVEASGVPIRGRVPTDVEVSTGAAMARVIAQGICGLTDILNADRPDALLLLGDRGEMLAGAIVGLHLNLPVVHVHGGERSGTVDEPVRHAISRLSHYHFVATEGSAERLRKSGEEPGRIFVTGAPGLDEIRSSILPARSELWRDIGLDPDRGTALMLFHPVVQSAETAGTQAISIIEAIKRAGLQAICLTPNSDAGSAGIREAVLALRDTRGFFAVSHIKRSDFLGYMAHADIMVGNSSAGIIEAASFGTPVVNVGDRQHLRERNSNVLDVGTDVDSVYQGITAGLKRGKLFEGNIYGDGCAGERIVELLASVPLTRDVLMKSLVY